MTMVCVEWNIRKAVREKLFVKFDFGSSSNEIVYRQYLERRNIEYTRTNYERVFVPFLRTFVTIWNRRLYCAQIDITNQPGDYNVRYYYVKLGQHTRARAYILTVDHLAYKYETNCQRSSINRKYYFETNRFLTHDYIFRRVCNFLHKYNNRGTLISNSYARILVSEIRSDFFFACRRPRSRTRARNSIYYYVDAP